MHWSPVPLWRGVWPLSSTPSQGRKSVTMFCTKSYWHHWFRRWVRSVHFTIKRWHFVAPWMLGESLLPLESFHSTIQCSPPKAVCSNIRLAPLPLFSKVRFHPPGNCLWMKAYSVFTSVYVCSSRVFQLARQWVTSCFSCIRGEGWQSSRKWVYSLL